MVGLSMLAFELSKTKVAFYAEQLSQFQNDIK
jgi:hypothetical protein